MLHYYYAISWNTTKRRSHLLVADTIQGHGGRHSQCLLQTILSRTWPSSSSSASFQALQMSSGSFQNLVEFKVFAGLGSWLTIWRCLGSFIHTMFHLCRPKLSAPEKLLGTCMLTCMLIVTTHAYGPGLDPLDRTYILIGWTQVVPR